MVEVNTVLASDSALVNTDPYGTGWMFKLKSVEEGEAGSLMDADEYRKQIGE